MTRRQPRGPRQPSVVIVASRFVVMGACGSHQHRVRVESIEPRQHMAIERRQ